MRMRLSYIADAVKGILSPSSNGLREISGFYSDSRSPEMNKMFLAIRGERVDGNEFVPKLMEQGYCALTDRKDNLSFNGDCIYVNDVREALRLLAKHYRLNEVKDTTFVGITGSVGKTTTKDMVALALSSSLSVHKTAGNSNSQIGLPQTVLAVEKGIDCAVVELGMSYPGEMERISRCACPDISIITNIGCSHIENLGSREAIRNEKLDIVKFSKDGSYLILNGDEPLLRDIEVNNKKIVYVSVSDENCDCYAKDIEESLSGIAFTACVFGNEYKIKLSVCGKHFISNSLFALAVAYILGIDVKLASEKLCEYQSDGKRQYVYETNGHTVISDCYNASPESMKAALSVLASSKGRRIAVLGDMLELGKDSPSYHAEVGKFAGECADVLITFGEMAINIALEADVKEIYSFEEAQREKLHEFLKDFVKEGDVVLYKASNGMNLGSLII